MSMNFIVAAEMAWVCSLSEEAMLICLFFTEMGWTGVYLQQL